MEVKLRAYPRIRLSFPLKTGLKRVSCSTIGTATWFVVVSIGITTGCPSSQVKAFWRFQRCPNGGKKLAEGWKRMWKTLLKWKIFKNPSWIRERRQANGIKKHCDFFYAKTVLEKWVKMEWRFQWRGYEWNGYTCQWSSLAKTKVMFLFETLLNNHEKNNYIFVLALEKLTTKILKRKDWRMHKREATRAMNEASKSDIN